MKFLPLLLLLGGCIPAPLSFISYGKMGLDSISIINGNKTTTDAIVSGITERDCDTHHILDGADYCEKTLKEKLKEYIDENKQQ